MSFVFLETVDSFYTGLVAFFLLLIQASPMHDGWVGDRRRQWLMDGWKDGWHV